MNRFSLFLIVSCTMMLSFSSCKRVSTGGVRYPVQTLEADAQTYAVTLRGRVASGTDLSQVSDAGFLVSESKSFPDGSTLDMHKMSEIDPDGYFSTTLEVKVHLGDKRGTAFYYKAWILRDEKREFGKDRSFLCPEIEIQSISFNPSYVRINAGESVSLGVKIEPEEATDKTLSWSSDNENIAKVLNGVVTGVFGGKTIIKATHGKVSAQCEVSVKGVQPDKSVDLGFGPYWYSYGYYLKPSGESYYSYAGAGPWYRWGETAPKATLQQYDFASYDYNKFKSITVLPKEYDAASRTLGGSWRTPTREEYDQLFANCTVDVKQTGYGPTVTFTSKINGKTLIFDETGRINLASESSEPNVSGANANQGCYWTATTDKDNPGKAYGFYFDSYSSATYYGGFFTSFYKYSGLAIRPVAD